MDIEVNICVNEVKVLAFNKVKIHVSEVNICVFEVKICAFKVQIQVYEVMICV